MKQERIGGKEKMNNRRLTKRGKGREEGGRMKQTGVGGMENRKGAGKK